jgi:hypothetical protein
MEATPAVRRARPRDVPALAWLIATTFLDRPYRRPWLRRLGRGVWLYFGAWGELVAGGAWTDTKRDAVLCDSSTQRPLRAALTLSPFVLFVAAGFIALFYALPLWAGIALVVVAAPGYAAMVRLLRQNRAVRRRHRPEAIVVMNFASRRRGAGRPVLARLCAKADADDRWLCLDAAADQPRLMDYYRQFGFLVPPGSSLGSRVFGASATVLHHAADVRDKGYDHMIDL